MFAFFKKMSGRKNKKENKKWCKGVSKNIMINQSFIVDNIYIYTYTHFYTMF